MCISKSFFNHFQQKLKGKDIKLLLLKPLTVLVRTGLKGTKCILCLFWKKQMNKKFFFQQFILIFAVLQKNG